MKSDNFALVSLKHLFVSTIKHFLFWPLWWISGGLWLTLKFTGRQIAKLWHGLALDIWLKNIFRPMYGQYDAVSRLISFIIRLLQIAFRLVIFVVITALILLWPVFYLILPVVVIWQLV